MNFKNLSLSLSILFCLLPLSLKAMEPSDKNNDVVIGTIATPKMDFELPGSDGKTYKLSQFGDDKIVVLEWFNHGCPFVRKHYDSQNMQRLQKTYGAKGVVWLTIVSSAEGKQGHTTAAEAVKIRTSEGMNSMVTLLDPTGKVGKQFEAQTTPHMYILKAGTVLYQGAIDSNPSTKSSDIANSINYVKENLDLLLDKKDVKYTKTKAYGCAVKYL
jgi:peroxiredoxin